LALKAHERESEAVRVSMRREAAPANPVTFDHRMVDGRRAADFGLAVIERLRDG